MLKNGKVAVLVNGIYRPQYWSLESLQNSIKKIFPQADIFYHTWDNHVSSIPEGIEVHSCPEPIIHYNPMQDPELCDSIHYKNYRRGRIDEKKMCEGTKQILGYADLYDKVNGDYDIFIRLRWDVVIDLKYDFSELLEKAYDHPIGFMSREKMNWPESGRGKVQLANDHDTNCYLPDMMIFHHRKHFDTNLVRTLHENKQLWPAEWGWYQVMSRPYGDIHQSFHYGVKLSRFVFNGHIDWWYNK
jgi:hypothetical protein